MFGKVFIFLFFLQFTAPALSQEKTLRGPLFDDLQITNAVTKAYGDSTFTFHVNVQDEYPEPIATKRYYWFHQGTMTSTQGNYSGKLLHGTLEKFDRKGRLLEKGIFKNGLKEGEWMRWYANGNISSQYHWNAGWRVGDFQEFADDGSLLRKGSYRQNKLHGKVYYYAPGGSTAREEKYRRGALVKEKEKKVKEKKVKGKKKGKDQQPGTTQQTAPGTTPEPKKKGLFSWLKKKEKNATTTTTPAPERDKKKNTKEPKPPRQKKVKQPDTSTTTPAVTPSSNPEKTKKRREKEKKER